MEGKTVNRVYDDRDASEPGCQTAEKSRLGIMGMDNMIGILFEEPNQSCERAKIFCRMQGLYHMFKGVYLHAVIPDIGDEFTAGRAGQIRTKASTPHAFHG